MEKTIIVDGREVRMRASALIPRLYRVKFGRDFIKDMAELQVNYDKAVKSGMSESEKAAAQLSVIDLVMFENVAWLMARDADKTVPDTPEEWLDQFEMFSIFDILPTIMELWNITNRTTSKPRKK